ncbi:hypothetical protein [Mycolicibacterium sp.]|jgi:hypothetical protein|uniref:hypothetical protein n=1 Tax=Mycolicibacterium sp. TaxID=2320850 RepID=UPI001A225716|nr:hypothetical protein [Mycolicibacterium sp.]MBJ7401441.1 hypothetical protein [Mycolicibacterium sp.]
MQRRAATATHLALALLGAILYLLFVLPRWWVLAGDIPTTPATVGRIAAGVPIALAAVPVALNLRQSLKTGASTPELALRLRAWSAVLQVLAGVLIILTALAETWVGLDAAGPWLFAVYGAAASMAVLGIAAFYLSRVAEKPPAAPKPPKASQPPQEKNLKETRERKSRAAKRGGTINDTVTTDDSATPDEAADGAIATLETVAANSDAPEVETVVVETPTDVVEADDVVDADETVAAASADADEAPAGGLRNKRPTGKRRHRLPR